MSERWFHDYVPGTTAEHGPLRVSADDVVDFGRRFDPQPFHVDAEAAAAGPFGGLIASGWHTCAIAMRLVADKALHGSESFASPGIEYIRWPHPVRPGDQLMLTATVQEVRRSASKPGLGILRWRWELANQDGAAVLDLVATSLFELEETAG